MTRFSSLIFVLTLVLMSGVSVAVAAPVILHFDPPNPVVSSGNQITFNVVAEIPDPVIGYGLDLQFDNVALSLDGVEAGSRWLSAKASNGSPLVGLAFPGPVSGPGIVLATVHLHVNQSGCKGATTISVDAKADDLTEGFALEGAGFADFTPASATISLVDVTPPVIANVFANPAVLWPPNHQMVDVALNYGVSDNCDLPQAVACSVSVSSSEPANGTGDGNTAPDAEVIDAHHVRLRAERSGAGSGRIYTNTITCRDSSGNVSSQDAVVTVPHDQQP